MQPACRGIRERPLVPLARHVGKVKSVLLNVLLDPSRDETSDRLTVLPALTDGS